MTIRMRLALIYGLAIAVTLGLVGTLVWWQMRAALRSSLDQTLATRAAAVSTAMDNEGQVGLQDGDALRTPGVFVAIFDPKGNLIDASPNTPSGFRPPGARDLASELAIGDATYAVYTMTTDNGARVVAGADMASLNATLDRLARLLVTVGGLAAFASLAGGWLLAGRALRPVALITIEAGQIREADLGRRLPIPAHRDELFALVATLNEMLDRVAEATRRQRAFVAAASHDLRTPIAALQAELELAGDERTTEAELRDAVRAAHGDVVRLGELATALLDLAAAGADGRELVRSPVRSDALIESVLRRVSPLARDRGTVIRPSAAVGVIRVDRVRLEQAIANLVINAIKYGPPGAEVEVTARFDAAPADTNTTSSALVIEVEDRGPGIPRELEDRLFEPFQRGPDPAEPGTGLGLATAAAAVRAHKGSIGYEPRPGGGSRFWIRIPV